MRTRHLFSGLFAAFVAFTLVNTASAASLTLPDELQAQNAEVGHKQSVLALGSGKQLVELVYRDIFADNADDSGAWVTSEPLYLALDVQGDDDYRLVLPEIVTKQDAQAFLSAPKARLISQSGQQLELSLMNHQQLMEKIWLAQ